LGVALLDERERVLQSAILTGPAPLGPGPVDQPPTPAARLDAFFDAYLDYVLGHLDLSRMSETASPGARYRIGAYRFWHRHVTILLAAMSPHVDAEAIAHTLLATVAAEHLLAITTELDQARTRSAIRRLVAAVASLT